MKAAGLLRDLVSSGHAVDFILAIIVAEFIFLSRRRATRASPGSMLDIVFSLAPGACLLLALRAALSGAGWTWVAAFLALSFPFHIIDLMRRRLF